MIVSVHQPQYLPWLGYFEKIDQADVFVLLDTVQYKKNEWQNRNKIKTAAGWQWITVPVTYRFPQLIRDVCIENNGWQRRHKQALLTNYRKAPYWKNMEESFEELFTEEWDSLAKLNIYTVRKLAEILGIATPLYVASELGDFPDDPDERLISLVRYFGGDTYLAGSGGRNYMQMDAYTHSGIEVIFQKYVHPVYTQLFGEFEPFMSTIDVLFNCGRESLRILRGNT